MSIRLLEAYFDAPGPRCPGTTTYQRHYHDSEFLLVHDPALKCIHIQKRVGKKPDGSPGNAQGPVRSADASKAEWIALEVPVAVTQAHAAATKK